MNFDDLSIEQLHDLLLLTAREGGIPAPEGYTDNGRPVWSIEALAAFFGMTSAQIDQAIDNDLARLADVAWAGPGR